MTLKLSVVLIAFRLQSEFGHDGHGREKADRQCGVLIAFRLQSEFGPQKQHKAITKHVFKGS